MLAVVVVAVAWRGGYGQNARAVVAALAGLAVVGALAWAPVRAAAAWRSPVVLSLAAIAALSALSAAWTIGSASEALRDGLAILAMAAVVVVAATLRPPWIQAGLLLGAALAVAVVGLGAAITRSDPLALQICGTWRPAGPFEYPPTLGLVSAGALPVALALGANRRRAVAAAGALGAWVLAVSIGLTANRTAIALGSCAAVAAVWLAPRTRELGPLALAVTASATASVLVVGSRLGDAGAGRLLAAFALASIPCVVAASGAGRGSGRRRAWVVVLAVVAVAVTAGSVGADRGSGCQGDASHGRIGIWKAAVSTATDRPVQGYGSGTFLAASRVHQLSERPRPTRFAHNLPLELWVELGLLGVLLVIAWYVAVGGAIATAVRTNPDAYLLVPFAAAVPLANLLDWPWHLLGAGILWSVAFGGLLAARWARAARSDLQP